MRYLLLAALAGALLGTLCIPGCGTHHTASHGTPGMLDVAAQLSALAALTPPQGVAPTDWADMKGKLAAYLQAHYPSGKVTSTPPAGNASKAPASFDPGTSTLSWGYYSAGDYDQNGLVTIGELTPLGVHLGASSGGGPFPADSINAVVDGDSNGQINISDLTPIGANLGNHVSQYNVYVSQSQSDYPASNGATSTITALGTVLLSAATGTPSAGRLQFSFTIPAPGAGDIYWVRPSDGTTEGTPSAMCGPGAPVTGDISLYQTTFVDASGNVVLSNSTWGEVDVSFTGNASLLYFTMDWNGNRVLTNIPLKSDEGIGAPTELDLPFALGNTEGTAVTSGSVSYSLGTSKSPSALRSSLTRQASGTFVKPVIRKDIQNEPYYEPDIHVAVKELGRNPANDGTIVDGAAHDIEFLNQDITDKNITQTATGVSNSLYYLEAKFGLDLGTPDPQTMMDNWAPSAALPDVNWPKQKDAYMKAASFPVTTKETNNIYEVVQAMKDGCDVERFFGPGDSPNFAHAVTSVLYDNQKNVVMQEQWDAADFKVGGLVHSQIWYKFDTSADAPYGQVLKSGIPTRFVIECPTAAALWQHKNLYENNNGGIYPSAILQSNGHLALSQYVQTASGNYVSVGTIDPYFFMQSPAVNVLVDATRTHGPDSDLIELFSKKLAEIYDDNVPFEHKLTVDESTDATGATWGGPVVMDTQSSGTYTDIHAFLNASGKLDVFFLKNTDPMVLESTDNTATAFTVAQFVQPFTYGLNAASSWNGSHSVSAWEGSGSLVIAKDLNFTTGAAVNTTTLPVATIDDTGKIGLVYNANTALWYLSYEDTSAGLQMVTSSDGGVTWSAPVTVRPAPFAHSGLSLALLGQAPNRYPAICAVEGADIVLHTGLDPAGTTWAAPETVGTPNEVLGVGWLDMLADPNDPTGNNSIIFGPSSEAFRSMAMWYYK